MRRISSGDSMVMASVPLILSSFFERGPFLGTYPVDNTPSLSLNACVLLRVTRAEKSRGDDWLNYDENLIILALQPSHAFSKRGPGQE